MEGEPPPEGCRVLPLECHHGDIPQPKQICIEGEAMQTVERMILGRPQPGLGMGAGVPIWGYRVVICTTEMPPQLHICS